MREFRRACHEAARSTGGRALEFQCAVYPLNFEQALVAYEDRTIVVLRQEWNLLAAAEHQPTGNEYFPSFVPYGRPSFVDEPELLMIVSQILPGTKVFSRADLEGPLVLEEWPYMSYSDVTYWKPGNLGEALFNCWD
ncbi:hypothetical protein [Amycolatopsis keratiniphila]|uniref:Uncharacterized protein n=1 Tax=Amycolatopsis keratiniphila subsp. keratiniphila TaxID=227715 RepID=A0A1W2LIV7_9PSEU|nr:hypothetical protein [Amycolatopsis keratiniphila]ONF62791.1 hypothetical protein AVR91_0235575 [Amycolatopsis keratiniphila subsp. keratiniphila]